MKQYEYKFVRSKAKLGFDYQQKLTETEAEWNDWGLRAGNSALGQTTPLCSSGN